MSLPPLAESSSGCPCCLTNFNLRFQSNQAGWCDVALPSPSQAKEEDPACLKILCPGEADVSPSCRPSLIISLLHLFVDSFSL
jgi:hypothetical protein